MLRVRSSVDKSTALRRQGSEVRILSDTIIMVGINLYNQPLIAAVISWIITQSIKVIIDTWKTKRFDFKHFISSGGFPSSHCAAVSALTVSIGIHYGFDSGLFAISLVFALIVIFDAQGVRQATGKQAEVLNIITKELYIKRGLKITRLKELLGHTPLEVFMGIIFGIVIGILVN